VICPDQSTTTPSLQNFPTRIPSMAPAEGTILVTGANGGLGSAIARQIAQTFELSSKYHGVFVVRNVDMPTTLKGIVNRAPTSFNHDTVSIDLSHLSSVREGAKAINARVADGSLPPIWALILSAGFQELETQAFSSDGFDMTFQVNYLSHFLLVLLLLQSLDKEHGRIVIVSGWNHEYVPSIILLQSCVLTLLSSTEDKRNDVAGIYKDKKYKVLFHNTESLAKGTWSSQAEDPSSLSGQRRYGAAHLCEVMFM
jgi:NAD(P)-dependent dehydrogenase (short-subunit alcohol dehydrogenase family)